MPPRPRTLTEADQATWAAYANRVAPLRGRQPLPPPPDTAHADPALPSPPHTPPPGPAARARLTPIGVGGQPAGLDSASWQRFHRGKLAVARKLDLHGMTAQAAFHALRVFLRDAHADHLRCVEIVTGRGSGEGGGVLRRELPMWLNLPEIRPLVLAAVHPHVANPGAVRVLLRRPRP